MIDFNIFVTSKSEVPENLELKVGKVSLDYFPMPLGRNCKWSDFIWFTCLWKILRKLCTLSWYFWKFKPVKCGKFLPKVWTQWAFGAKMTSYRRLCDVIYINTTSVFVMCPLGKFLSWLSFRGDSCKPCIYSTRVVCLLSKCKRFPLYFFKLNNLLPTLKENLKIFILCTSYLLESKIWLLVLMIRQTVFTIGSQSCRQPRVYAKCDHQWKG